jgi:hypothetical protein
MGATPLVASRWMRVIFTCACDAVDVILSPIVAPSENVSCRVRLRGASQQEMLRHFGVGALCP